MIINICKNCKKEFTKPHNPNREYDFCSKKCYGSAKKKESKVYCICVGCNLVFSKRQSNPKKYCTKKCMNKHYEFSEKAKKKMAMAKLKNPTRYWLGKNRPDLDLSNRVLPSGENHWNWQGGITPINEKIRKSSDYKLWRKAVFERDNYTCVHCLTTGGNLHADHIKPFALYPELRLAIDNGRTLCEDCHKRTKTWGYSMMYRENEVASSEEA